jgi:cob(I)alamin adenosyltransferase
MVKDMADAPRILVFTGDGKGKTTAALGMALRAAGHGLHVCVIQFIKNDATTGELAAAAKVPGIQIIQTGLGFLPKPGSPEFARHKAAAEDGLRKAGRIIASGVCSLVVLDEACLAVARGLLDEKDVMAVVRQARPDDCVVLTGRGATPGLIELADTVTEMRCVKHGLASGRAAQKGVEK